MNDKLIEPLGMMIRNPSSTFILDRQESPSRLERLIYKEVPNEKRAYAIFMNIWYRFLIVMYWLVPMSLSAYLGYVTNHSDSIFLLSCVMACGAYVFSNMTASKILDLPSTSKTIKRYYYER